jgi:hypothetical protein
MANNDSDNEIQKESSISARKNYIAENSKPISEKNLKRRPSKYSITNWIRENYWNKMPEKRQQKLQVFYFLNGTFDYLIIELILALAFIEYAFKSANGDIGLTLIGLAILSIFFIAVSVCTLIFLFFWPLGDLFFVYMNLFLFELAIYFFIRVLISLIIVKFFIYKFD